MGPAVGVAGGGSQLPHTGIGAGLQGPCSGLSLCPWVPPHTGNMGAPNRSRDVFTRTAVGKGEEKDAGAVFLGEEMNNSPQEGSRREEEKDATLASLVAGEAQGTGWVPSCWPWPSAGRCTRALAPQQPFSPRSLSLVMRVFPASGF